MRKVTNTFTAGDFRLTIFDDGTYKKVRIVPGIIISINYAQEAKQVSENGNVFWIATVECDLPSGKKTGPAIVWDAHLNNDKLPADTFAPGASINVSIQVNGEYSGNAEVQLPYYEKKINKDKFPKVVASPPTSGSKIKVEPIPDNQHRKEKKGVPEEGNGGSFLMVLILVVFILLMWFIPEFIRSGGSVGKGLNAIGSNIIGWMAFIVIAAFVIGIMGKDSHR